MTRTQVRGRRAVVELEVFAEHTQQVLFQTHHQRVHPSVKQDIGTLKAHLRRVTRREILHMHGRRNDRARHAQALGNVTLHLGAQEQLRVHGFDRVFDFQIVVRD